MPIARRDSSRAPFGRSATFRLRAAAAVLALAGTALGTVIVPSAFAATTSTVSVSNPGGTVVDPRGFAMAADASLTSGACPADRSAGDATTLPDADWTFLVSTADGTRPLSTDDVARRRFRTSNGEIVSASTHDTAPRECAGDPSGGGPVTVALAPFAALPPGATAYRVAVAPTSAVNDCLATGDATGFGCRGLALRTTIFTIAGAEATTTRATVSATSIAAGGSVTDEAAVTGGTTAATGTVVWWLCPGSTCASGGEVAAYADLSSGAATSPAISPPAAGAWTLRAEYWGDATHAASHDTGTNQTVTVAAAPSGEPSATDGSATPTPASTPSGGDGSKPSPTSGATETPGATATGGTTAPATASPTPRTTPTPTRTSRPPAVPPPTVTRTPPPPPFVNSTPRPPAIAPVNSFAGGCASICYFASPTIFGPGWGSAAASTPGSTAISRNPNASAIDAYGSGGIPHFPGINAPVTGGGAGNGGAVGAGGAPGSGPGGSGVPTAVDPGASGVEQSAGLIIGPNGSPIAAAPSNAEALGGGASGAGISLLPAEAAGAITGPDGSVAGVQGAGAGGQPGGAPLTAAPANGSLPLVVAALFLLGVLVTGWVLRARRVRVPRIGR